MEDPNGGQHRKMHRGIKGLQNKAGLKRLSLEEKKMFKKEKALVSLIAIFAVLFFVVGCGNDDTDNTDDGTGQATYETDQDTDRYNDVMTEDTEAGNNDEDTEDDGDVAYHANNEIVGEWHWDETNTWYYTFNADGTGEQFPDTAFTWTVDGNELTVMMDGLPLRWEWVISGDTLTLSSLDVPDMVFSYTRP